MSTYKEHGPAAFKQPVVIDSEPATQSVFTDRSTRSDNQLYCDIVKLEDVGAIGQRCELCILGGVSQARYQGIMATYYERNPCTGIDRTGRQPPAQNMSRWSYHESWTDELPDVRLI